MKVAILTQDGFEIRNRPIPSCDPEQILVKTIACGICEGDVFTYRNRSKYETSEFVSGAIPCRKGF